MKMYTIDGTEVSVVKKIEEGYLAKNIYHYNGYNEEDEGEVEELCNEVNFYEKLYETPPTVKYAKEVQELITKRDALNKEIEALQIIKSNEKTTLNKISNWPFLKSLTSYLTKSFSFYLDFDRYEIEKIDKCYWSTQIKAVNFRSGGWVFYKLRNENSDSYDDRPFMVFDTIDECVEYSRTRLIADYGSYRKNEYWGSKGLKEAHDKISSTNPVKQDAKYLEVYNDTLSFLIDRETKREAEKLKKEIEEFETKKKKLESLGVVA
jgi:hypothetical protein